FNRHSSINRGSPFLVEINSITFSLRPAGTVSDSMSVMNPHLYSWFTIDSIVSGLVAMISSVFKVSKPLVLRLHFHTTESVPEGQDWAKTFTGLGYAIIPVPRPNCSTMNLTSL